MKKEQIMSIGVLIVTLLVMGVNMFIFPLTDWIVRIDGIIMLISIIFLSYSTVRCYRKA